MPTPAGTSRFLESVIPSECVMETITKSVLWLKLCTIPFCSYISLHFSPHRDGSREIIISLNSDSSFYDVLVSALRSLAEHQTKIQEDFTEAVQSLSRDISHVTYPSSSKRGKSDVYAWRQIFQMWVDAQIFESTMEKDRGERSVEESEAKLTEFANKAVKEGLGDGRTIQRKESRDALERFLKMNVLLLDLKKVNKLSIIEALLIMTVPWLSSSLPTLKLRVKL